MTASTKFWKRRKISQEKIVFFSTSCALYPTIAEPITLHLWLPESGEVTDSQFRINLTVQEAGQIAKQLNEHLKTLEKENATTN